MDEGGWVGEREAVCEGMDPQTQARATLFKLATS